MHDVSYIFIYIYIYVTGSVLQSSQAHEQVLVSNLYGSWAHLVGRALHSAQQTQQLSTATTYSTHQEVHHMISMVGQYCIQSRQGQALKGKLGVILNSWATARCPSPCIAESLEKNANWEVRLIDATKLEAHLYHVMHAAVIVPCHDTLVRTESSTVFCTPDVESPLSRLWHVPRL